MPYDLSGEFEPDDDSDDGQYAGFGGFPLGSYHTSQKGNISYIADASYSLIEGSILNPDGSWADYTNEPGGGPRTVAIGSADGSIKVQEYSSDSSRRTDGYCQIETNGTLSSSFVDGSGKPTEYIVNDKFFLRENTLDLSQMLTSYSQIDEVKHVSGQVIFGLGQVGFDYQNFDSSGNEGSTQYSPDRSLTTYSNANSQLTLATVAEVDALHNTLGYATFSPSSEVYYQRTASGTYTEYEQSDSKGNLSGYRVDSSGVKTLIAETVDASGVKVYTSGGIGNNVEVFTPSATDYQAKAEEEGLLGTVFDYTYESLDTAGKFVDKIDFGADLINQGLERNLKALADADQSFSTLAYTPFAQELDTVEQFTFKELMQGTAGDTHAFLQSVGGVIGIGSVVVAGTQYARSGSAADNSKLFNESVKLLLTAGVALLAPEVGLGIAVASFVIPDSWKNAALGYTQSTINTVVGAAGNAVLDYWSSMSQPQHLSTYKLHP